MQKNNSAECQHDALRPECTVRFSSDGLRAHCNTCQQTWEVPEEDGETARMH